MNTITTPATGGVAASTQFTPWTGAERESFFAAVARHRRAAWRVTLASGLADALFALVVAILMSPLFYVAIALVFDLVNLVHPAPNIVKLIAQLLDPVFEPAKGGTPMPAYVRAAFWVALPGFTWMPLVLLMLRRVLKLSDMFSGGELPAREPDPKVLAEQRFSNVIEEMALAAGLPTPRVLVANDPGLNAAAFGDDERHATIVLSTGLLERLNRDQLQGVAAHLVGSIANGDMEIGLRAATTLALFAFLARFSGLLVEKNRGATILRISRAMLRPNPASSRQLINELMDPDRLAKGTPAEQPARQRTDAQMRTWRDNVWLPLTGPVVITGFLSGLVQMLVLAPLVALAWRQRKYMADATAVRLTRDPDTLAGALNAMTQAPPATPFTAWAAHLAVVDAGTGVRKRLGGSLVSMYPSLGRRLLALQRMGAHTGYVPQRRPMWLVLIAVPLGMLLGGLIALATFLLAYVSLPVSALFLGIPFGVLHLLLRSHSA